VSSGTAFDGRAVDLDSRRFADAPTVVRYECAGGFPLQIPADVSQSGLEHVLYSMAESVAPRVPPFG
jgi:hypothetical protein